MAIKKIDDNIYEIFYIDTGFGYNYKYERITIKNNEITSRDKIEEWSRGTPC